MRILSFVRVALAAALMLPAGFSQEAQNSPVFEVASVKPFVPGGRNAPALPSSDPMQYSARHTLAGLVADAYGLGSADVTGGPSWVWDDFYEVFARTRAPASQAEMRLALRALLADRFQLKLHREMKDIRGSVLTVAQGGPKFGPQFRRTEDAGPPSTAFGAQQSERRYLRWNMKQFCAALEQNMRSTIANGRIVVHPDAAVPVIDQTGLAGVYDIIVRVDSADVDWAELVESQLGLKLTPGHARVEVLVIDSVTRPTEN